MSPKKTPKRDSLRRRAEKLLSRKADAIARTSPDDVKNLIHELQVHEIELQMQNEELRRAQADLETSRSKYADLYDFAPIGYMTLSARGRIKEINLAGAELLGLERGRLAGNVFIQYVAPESRAAFVRHFSTVIKSSDRVRCEVKILRKDGKTFYASLESVAVPEDGNWSMRSAIVDITERKRDEEDVLRANAGLEEKVIERTAEMEKEISQRKQTEEELRKSWDGLERRVEERTAELSRAREALEEEISQRKHAEEAMLRMHKMEALGTLAGGIAHDLNNILMPVIINTELALLQVPPGSSLAQSLGLVHEAANRGKELIKQIITFSRQKEQVRRPTDITPVIRESLKFLRASIPSNVEIRDRVDANPSIVETNPGQIHQVVINLCSNAAYAMRGKGGTLEVGLDNVEIDSGKGFKHLGLKPGPYVRLTVRDTGYGMDKKVMHRAFDPFFTTKRAGEGSGMGLAVVDGIVRSNGGVIDLQSEEGKGTTFQIFLPRSKSECPKEPVLSDSLPRGNESVLLVDDEEIQVDTVRRTLERLGYRVTGTTNPLEALELFRARPEAFDLVIVDQMMPHLTGDRLAKRLLSVRSDIPIILSTGFSEVVSEEEAKAAGIREFVMKPYSISEIATKIRLALRRTTSGT